METEIVAMDALPNSFPLTQYMLSSVKRDVNKAYCAFMDKRQEPDGAITDFIATGMFHYRDAVIYF